MVLRPSSLIKLPPPKMSLGVVVVIFDFGGGFVIQFINGLWAL